MPRIALVCLCLVGGCSFDADYAGGVYRCSDGNCPDGLVCEPNLDGDKVCRKPRIDAGIDGPDDGIPPDAMKHALNCADPYPFPATGGSYSDTTANRTSKLGAQCFNGVMNGPDTFHVIEPGAGKQMLVDIAASYSAAAYVISSCTTTSCNGNTYATPGNPIMLTTLAGKSYIVVDSLIATSSGAYTLTISFP
jgi:hypothetical protein